MPPSKYRVPPFSGKHYHVNSCAAPPGTSPCAICGQPVLTGSSIPTFSGHPHWAVVVDGGSEWGNEDSDEEDPGYMGWWPIGNDCHRRWKRNVDGDDP